MNKELSKYIEKAKVIVFFTGAGISTESGIPDFRGPKGFWKTNTPIYFQDFIVSEEVRRDSWNKKFSSNDIIRNAKPNIGHTCITSLIDAKPGSHLITQNVDNLHQDSGLSENKITEIHGNATYASCLDCNTKYELEPIKKAFLDKGTIPYCKKCSGIIKQATVSFGQSMPAEKMRVAEENILKCDLFVTIGTSLVVYPAAGFPQQAKEIGAKLIIINNQPTDYDHMADLVIHEQIGDVFSS